MFQVTAQPCCRTSTVCGCERRTFVSRMLSGCRVIEPVGQHICCCNSHLSLLLLHQMIPRFNSTYLSALSAVSVSGNSLGWDSW